MPAPAKVAVKIPVNEGDPPGAYAELHDHRRALHRAGLLVTARC